MFKDYVRLLCVGVLALSSLVLAGCYTRVQLFGEIPEEPLVVREERVEIVPRRYDYFHYYDPFWDDPFRVRAYFYYPSYYRWHYSWYEPYWYAPSWYAPYWYEPYRVGVPYYYYPSYYYRWGYYDYPQYYYYDPWWSGRYHRRHKEEPRPSRRRQYDEAIPRFSPGEGVERAVSPEDRTPYIEARPQERVEKKVIRREERSSSKEAKKSGQRTRKPDSSKGEKEEDESEKRRRKPSSERKRSQSDRSQGIDKAVSLENVAPYLKMTPRHVERKGIQRDEQRSPASVKEPDKGRRGPDVSKRREKLSKRKRESSLKAIVTNAIKKVIQREKHQSSAKVKRADKEKGESDSSKERDEDESNKRTRRSDSRKARRKR